MSISKIKKFRIIKYKNTVKPSLKIKNVSKSFNGVPVLSGLNLNIFPGSINGLLGENGSGKTTLFNLILGILKVDSGEVFVKGTDLTSMPNCKYEGQCYSPTDVSCGWWCKSLDDWCLLIKKVFIVFIIYKKSIFRREKDFILTITYRCDFFR